MKNHRLFGIIYLLLSRDCITAKELASYFEVSVRTIYRDIELLSSLHIPVYMNKGKNGGICLLEQFKLDKTLLTEKEQKEILFALESLDKLGIRSNAVFAKMKMFFQQDSMSWLAVDFTPWGVPNEENQTFPVVKEAILSRRRISFLYFNSYGQKNERIVEPLQILFKHNAWYLVAYDIHKEDYRIFKLHRMKNVQLCDETFLRDLPSRTDAFVDDFSIAVVSITLEIKKEMAFRVYDEFEEENIQLLENGDFLIHFEVPENDWVYGYILSFGEYVKVLAPQRVQDIIKNRIEKMKENYL